MARRDYERLDIKTFGEHLLETGDLDPVYIALDRVEWDVDQRDRWLVAYWSLYHCGAASYLSEREGLDFWRGLLAAAHNKDAAPTGGRWPRGHERRHFRGTQGVQAVNELQARYGDRPEDMVRRLGAPLNNIVPLSFQIVSSRVQEHRGFGPWMAFKVADMLDRLDIVPVSFDQAAVFMFEDPAAAAERLYRLEAKIPEDRRVTIRRDKVIPIVVDHLTKTFAGHMAPPRRDRPVGLQEVETILCKWKSHMNGHYSLFNDIDEVRAGLVEWCKASNAAGELLAAMPGRD